MKVALREWMKRQLARSRVRRRRRSAAAAWDAQLKQGSAVATATPRAATTASAAPVAAVARPARDDLKRIRGISAEIETALNRIDIRLYRQIAAWTRSDIDRVTARLDFRDRIERENWIEQAQVLAKGGETVFSRHYDRGKG